MNRSRIYDGNGEGFLVRPVASSPASSEEPVAREWMWLDAVAGPVDAEFEQAAQRSRQTKSERNSIFSQGE
jgi:hypothetical protein